MIKVTIDSSFKKAFKENTKKIIIISFILLIVINLIFITYCIQHTNRLEQKINALPRANNDIVIKRVDLSETEAYKLMYENLKYSNDKILDTVYWSLGGIAVAIFALIGANVFFNFRFNKKEIESITNSINTRIEEIKNSTYKDIQEKLDAYLKSSRDSMKDDFKELSHFQQSQTKTFSETFTSKIDSIKVTYDEAFIKVDENIKKCIQSQSNTRKELKEQIEEEIKSRRIEDDGLEAEIWYVKKIYANAMICYVRKATLELELNRNISNSLNRIIVILKESANMQSHYQNEFNVFLNKIPSGYELQKENIIGLVQKLPVN